MPSLRAILQRYIAYYVRLAQEGRNLSQHLASNISNLLRAAHYCVQIEDWPSLHELTRYMNPYWLKQAQWEDFIRFNQSLLQSDILTGDEVVQTIRQLASLEEKKCNYDAASNWYQRLLSLCEDHDKDIYLALDVLRKLSHISTISGTRELTIFYLEKGLESAGLHGLISEEADILLEIENLPSAFQAT